MRQLGLVIALATCGCREPAPLLATCAEAASAKLIVERCYGGDLYRGNYVGDSKCFPFAEPELFKGVWHVALEASHFTFSANEKSGADWWLDVPHNNASVVASMQGDKPRRFAVTFKGRRSLCPAGFGHMGVTPNEIVVHEMISMTPL